MCKVFHIDVNNYEIDFNFSFHSSQANDKLMEDIQNAIDMELGK